MSVKSGVLVSAVTLGALLVARSSHAIEPSKQECVAANESAQDLRQAGKLREAQVKLSVCIAASCPGPVREDCAQRLDEVTKAMPTVVFEVKDSVGRDLLDVRLAIDGQPVGLVPLTPLGLDPGPHVFRFEVAGKPGVEREVVLHEGEKQKRVSVFSFGGPAERTGLGATPESTGPGGKQGTTSAPRIEEPSPALTPPNGPDEQADRSRGDSQRLAGWITGGAGVAAVGFGIVLALSAKSSWENAPGCNGTQCTSNAGIDATNSARSTGVAATAVFIVGAAAATTGVVLWLTAPPAQPASTAGSSWRVGMTFGGVSAEGRF
jgi:hypothetical protein